MFYSYWAMVNVAERPSSGAAVLGAGVPLVVSLPMPLLPLLPLLWLSCTPLVRKPSSAWASFPTLYGFCIKADTGESKLPHKTKMGAWSKYCVYTWMGGGRGGRTVCALLLVMAMSAQFQNSSGQLLVPQSLSVAPYQPTPGPVHGTLQDSNQQGSGQGCPAAPQGPQDCKPSTLNFHILPLV